MFKAGARCELHHIRHDSRVLSVLDTGQLFSMSSLWGTPTEGGQNQTEQAHENDWGLGNNRICMLHKRLVSVSALIQGYKVDLQIIYANRKRNKRDKKKHCINKNMKQHICHAEFLEFSCPNTEKIKRKWQHWKHCHVQASADTINLKYKCNEVEPGTFSPLSLQARANLRAVVSLGLVFVF